MSKFDAIDNALDIQVVKEAEDTLKRGKDQLKNLIKIKIIVLLIMNTQEEIFIL